MKVVNVPPIVEMSVADDTTMLDLFARKTLEFGESLTAHNSGVLRRPGKSNFDVYGSARKAAEMVTQELRFQRNLGSDDRLFCYMLGGVPVGVMKCEGNNRGYELVGALACNPGLSGCGGALLEHAVALSMATGNEGRLSLAMSNYRLLDVYEAYGFVEIDDYLPYSDMTLKPDSSPKWQLVPVENPFLPQIKMGYRLLPPLSYFGG